MKRKLLLAALCVVGALGFKAQAQSLTPSEVSEGDFYLYNVGAEKFLNAGDKAAQWGTNACLTANYGLDFALAVSGDGYTLDSKNYNEANAHFLGTSLWTDGTTTTWIFTDLGSNVYTISSGEQYLVANAAGDDVELSATADGANAQWKLATRAALIADLATATEDNPKSARFLIAASDFNRNDSRAATVKGAPAGNKKWNWTNTNGNVTVAGPDAQRGNYGCEFWNNPFDINQILTDIPNGTYEFKISGYGTNGTTYIYGNGTEAVFKNQTSASNFATALDNIDSYTGNTTGKITVTTHQLKVGVKRTENKSSDWAVLDNADLIYYGPLDLSSYQQSLNEAIAAAEAIANGDEKMNAAVASALSNAISTYKGQTYDNEDNYVAAIDAVTTATNNASTSIANYDALEAYLDKAKTLDAAGQASLMANTTAQAVAVAYQAQTFEALNAEQKEALDEAIRTAAKAQTTAGADMTLALVNPSFEDNLNGWTSNGIGAQGNNSFEKVGTIYAEAWQPNGTKNVKQSLASLSAGVYKISAKAKARGVTSAKLFANGIDKAVTIGDVTGTYEVQFACDDNATIEFGFEGTGTGAGSSWLCVDDFHLTLVSAGLPDVTATEGKMNADVASAQTAAISAYTAERTVANYNAAQAAIANAQASVAAYKTAATAIADAEALQTDNNFVTPAAATTFAEAIAAIQTKYDDGTLTTDEATGVGASLGFVVTGWHAGANTPAVNYMESGFGLNDFDAALYLNTWSTEGEGDGTNFKVPFFEYWTSNANSLGEKVWTGTLTEMENGLYTVEAWVRVRAVDGTNAADVTGITMDVNGGGEGDYAAVDVTEGTPVGSTQFQLGTYTAKGLVKDGTLTVNFNVLSTCSSSWLSFKNVKYTKVRDLTPEEEIVYATDADYAVLERTIKAAEEKALGFDAGDYAPYNNVEALVALKAAKAIDPTVQNVQEDVRAAANALGQANWTANTKEVNAVYDGTFAAAANNGAPAGWTMSNNTLGGDYHSRAFVGDDRMAEFNQTKSGLFLRFDGTNSSRGSMYYYGNSDGYTMPLKANTTYYVKVDFAGWGSTGKPLRMNVTGPEGFTAKSQQFNTSVRADNADNEPQQFLIVFTTTVAGNYVINFQTPGADTNTHNVVVSNIELLRAQSVELAVDATAKYGTFVAPFDVTIPEGVIAYTVEAPAEGNVLTLNQEEKISANKPVLLYAENGYNATPVYGYAKPENEPKNGLLTGTYELNGAIAPTGSYVLQLHDGNTEPAFYRVEDNASFAVIVPTNRAYLTLSAGSNANVRALFFSTEGEATGIAGLEVLTSGNYDAIYTAGGAKVESLQKGLNIVVKDGKSYKIFVK